MVAAVGAVIAGLGGAFIAGGFNRKNTRTSIESAAEIARMQFAHQRELEHIQWLRDRKVEVYTTFLAKVREANLLVNEYYRGYKIDETGIWELTRELNAGWLTLYAPPDVASGVSQVLTALSNEISAVRATKESGSRHDEVSKATNILYQRRRELERLMREDLGMIQET